MGVALPPSEGQARRELLADFLRTRRAAVTPAQAGLPVDGSRRRTPGLRREEVAQRAGVGISWYTWLEQGRDITPSPQVLDALARALRLTPAEHKHLFHLTGVERPLPGAAYVRTAPEALTTFVHALEPHPAYLLGPRFDVLAHNAPAALVMHGLVAAPGAHRNLLRWLFVDSASWLDVPSWNATARANLADFRAEYARHPGHASFAELVDELTEASETFRTWWAEHDVAAFEPVRKQIPHPELGVLNLLQLQSVPAHEPDLRLRVLVPADEATRAALALPAVSG